MPFLAPRLPLSSFPCSLPFLCPKALQALQNRVWGPSFGLLCSDIVSAPTLAPEGMVATPECGGHRTRAGTYISCFIAQSCGDSVRHRVPEGGGAPWGMWSAPPGASVLGTPSWGVALRVCLLRIPLRESLKIRAPFFPRGRVQGMGDKGKEEAALWSGGSGKVGLRFGSEVPYPQRH